MKQASWERNYCYESKLHIWLSENSRADISVPCDTYKQAKIIASTYGITNVHKQNR